MQNNPLLGRIDKSLWIGKKTFLKPKLFPVLLYPVLNDVRCVGSWLGL